jgi:hypothetical protein
MILCPDTTTSDSQAVTVAAATMSPTMTSSDTWLFTCSTNCWIAQGAAPTAAAADGSMFVPANVLIVISGRCGAKLSVIRDTADGKASLTRTLNF